MVYADALVALRRLGLSGCVDGVSAAGAGSLSEAVTIGESSNSEQAARSRVVSRLIEQWPTAGVPANCSQK